MQIEDEEWGLAGPLPDIQYFKKLFSRHIKFAAIGMTIVLIGSLWVGLNTKNVYESKVFGIFDRNDISGSGIGVSSQASYDTVLRLFKARFESQDFLYQLGLQAGGEEALKDDPSIISKSISSIIKKIKQSIGRGVAKSQSKEEEKLSLAKLVADKIQASAEDGSGIFSVSAKASDPKKAAHLAGVAMNLFIREELKDQAAAVEKKLAGLERGVQSVTGPPITQDSKHKSGGKDVSPLKKIEIEEQERRLQIELSNLRSEISKNKKAQESERLSHKVRVNRLLTDLQPNHPLVQAQNLDLDTKVNALRKAEADLSNNLESAQQKLWRVRVARVNSQQGSLSSADSDNYRGAFFVAVADRIKDLTLERINLQRQIDDPSARTRMKVLFPPTVDKKPIKSRRKQFTLITFFLGTIFIFSFMFYKEVMNPIARDDWRVERYTKRPILSQVSSKSLKKYKRIKPSDADALREELSHGNSSDISIRTLLSYRRLELAVNKHSTGRIILLTSAGPVDSLGSPMFSFLNIYATDTGKKCLAWDFDHIDPLVPQINRQRVTDFIEILNGQKVWKEAVVKKDNKHIAFDLIPPSMLFKEENTRLLTEKLVLPIVQEMSRSYDVVFLRGFPEYKFIENLVLNQSATDSIICVDAHRSKYKDLDRTITHLDSDKLRGLVLIGT